MKAIIVHYYIMFNILTTDKWIEHILSDYKSF